MGWLCLSNLGWLPIPKRVKNSRLSVTEAKKKISKVTNGDIKKIVLSPDNKEFKDIVLMNVSGDDFHVVAEFIVVL